MKSPHSPTRGRRALGIALALALGSAMLAAPPADAQDSVNRQDEVVNIVLGPGEGADEALAILRSDDKLETNDYVSTVVELKNAIAYEVVFPVREAVGLEKGVARSVVTAPQDGSAPRQFIVFSTTEEQTPSILRMIEALDVRDVANTQGSTRYAYRARYRLASDLLTALRNTRLTQLARVFADDLSNTIYMDDTKFVMEKTMEYLSFFDVPAPQVEFDVRVFELQESDVRKIGLDWDAWKRSLGGSIGATGNLFEGLDKFARLDALLVLDASTLADFLNYTTQNGHARVLKRARITATNLQPAIISENRRVPFVTYERTERNLPNYVIEEKNVTTDASGEIDPGEEPVEGPRVVAIVPPVNSRRVDRGTDSEGLEIFIQPVIGADAITADIDVTLGTADDVDSLDRPIVTTQRVQNQVTLVNGQELLLGTLEREHTVKATRGIPGLKDIPYVGKAFGVEVSHKDSGRLFVLATPSFPNFIYGARDILELKTRPVLETSDGTPSIVKSLDQPVLEPGD